MSEPQRLLADESLQSLDAEGELPACQRAIGSHIPRTQPFEVLGEEILGAVDDTKVLRISEILGLQWGDFDFEAHTFMVQRSVVSGRMDAVKTEYSKDYVPLDPRLEGLLLEWRTFSAYPSDADWVFANPQTGKPFHQESLKKHQLHRVAELIGLPDGIGWHTFRHTYRSWLDETDAPMKVQQDLMRHASIQTTMNIYGRAMNDSKRKANSQVVGLAFGESMESRREALSTTALQ